MDPLIPKFSTYEMDYTADIQHKMRVPDKISYDSDKSLQGDEETGTLRNYTVADLVLDSTKPNFMSPGYSPDLLNDADVRPSTLTSAQLAAVNDPKFGVTTGAHAASCSDLRPGVSVSSPPASAKSVEHLEARLSQLQRRLSSLEFQQNLVGTGLTLYIAFRLLRWLLRALQ